MKKLEMELSLHQKEFRNLRQMFENQVANLNNHIAAHEQTIKEQAEQIADLLEMKEIADGDIARMQ